MSLSDRIDKARSDAEMMIEAIRKAPRASTDLLASAPGQQLSQRSDLSRAEEQYRHNRGWVFACTRAIAQRVASQPVHVARIGNRTRIAKAPAWLSSDDASKLEVLSQHPLINVLNDPNDLMVLSSLLHITITSLELTGRAFWQVIDKQTILPIPVHWIQNCKVTKNRFVSWTMRLPNTSEDIEVAAEELLCFTYPTPSDPLGCQSPLQSVAAAVIADESIGESQCAFFAKGIHPSYIIRIDEESLPNGQKRPRTLSGAHRAQITNTVRQIYQGMLRAGEPMILDAFIKSMDRISATGQEMDFLNSGLSTKARICQAFGVNPIVLGETVGGNRAQAVVAERNLVDNVVNPKIALLSHVMTAWLGPLFQKENERLVIWIEPASVTDAELELQFWDLGFRFGSVTKNEFRTRILGLPPLVGGDVVVNPGLGAIEEVTTE